jgi:predicted MFS family arabinose efflux permease
MLFGLSAGNILNTGYTVTTKYFKKNRALATGITASGVSLGMMILGPIIEKLVEVLHWRNTFRVMAGVMLLVCILSSTYDPIRVEGGQEQQKRGCVSIIDCTVFRNASYTIGLATITLSFFGLYVPLIHLVSNRPFSIY